MIHISGHLWLGNLTTASNEKILRAQKITKVLTIIHDADIVGGVRDNAERLGIGHKALSVHDCKPFEDGGRIAWEILPWLKDGMDVGENALIHCYAGISRSSSMVVAYLVWNGMSVPEALELLINRHPIAVPHPKILASCLRPLGHALPENYQAWVDIQWEKFEKSGSQLD